MKYSLTKNNTPIAGPGPETEIKRLANSKGGTIFPATIIKPPLNRTQTYGAYEVEIQQDKVVYTYPVVDLPLKIVCEGVVDEIAAEAERRIINLWVPAKKEQTLTNALMYQQNAGRVDETDPRFTKTDAIRTASNDFEAALADMDTEALAALVVREWDGWPVTEAEEIASE